MEKMESTRLDNMNQISLHRNDIQALRGIAVIAVVLFHGFSNIFPQGYLGVDLFFVISGFVMTPQILDIFQRQKDSKQRIFPKLRAFYIRRFYRLAPAFGVFTLFACALILLFGNLADHGRFTMQGIYSSLLFGNVGAFRFNGDYFNPNPNPLVHLWSLSTEEQIYIFIPLYLILCVVIFRFKNFTNNNFRKCLLVAVGFSSLFYYFSEHMISILAFSHLNQLSWIISEPFSYYSPIHRLIEFSIGALVASYQRKALLIQQIYFRYIRILATLVLVAGLFFPYVLPISENFLELIVSASAAILLLLPSYSREWSRLFHPLVWCGDRSYSMYLYHLPLIYVVQIGFFSRINISISYLTTLTFFITGFMAHVTYRFVEEPNRVRGRGLVNGKALDFVFFKSLLIYFFLPCLFLASMNIANNYKYFGLDRNSDPPPSAATLDSECKRDSLSGGPCIYSTVNGLGSVLLIGDSHAAMLSQVIVDEARKAQWNAIIWTHNGYPPRLEETADFTSNPFSDLSVTNTIAQIKWIEENNPEIVIISSLLLSRDQPMFRNAVQYLNKISKRVIVVNETPLFTDSRFFNSYSILEEPYVPQKSVALSEMNQSAFRAGEKFSIWAKTNDIETIDTVDLFCDVEQCNRYDKSGWLYFDNSHLSVYGAQLLGPRIRILFQDTK